MYEPAPSTSSAFSTSKLVSYALLALIIGVAIVMMTGHSQMDGLDDFTDLRRARTIADAANFAGTMGVDIIVPNDLPATVLKLQAAAKTNASLQAGPAASLPSFDHTELTHAQRFLQLDKRTLIVLEKAEVIGQ